MRSRFTFEQCVMMLDVQYDALVKLTTTMKMMDFFNTPNPSRLISRAAFADFIHAHSFTTFSENMAYVKEHCIRYHYITKHQYTENGLPDITPTTVNCIPDIPIMEFLRRVECTDTEKLIIYHLVCAIQVRWGKREVRKSLSLIKNMTMRRLRSYPSLLKEVDIIRLGRYNLTKRNLPEHNFKCTEYPSFCMRGEKYSYGQKDALARVYSKWKITLD